MYNGRATVILLDPTDFDRVAFGLQSPFELRRIGIPYRHTRAIEGLCKGSFKKEQRARSQFCDSATSFKFNSGEENLVGSWRRVLVFESGVLFCCCPFRILGFP